MTTGSLRILSYNVRYFGHALRGLASTRRSMHHIGACLAALSPLPDVICLQEVETRSLRSNVLNRAGNEETQLEAFMGELESAFARAGEVCPYEAFYFRAHSYRFRNVPIYTTGLAILVNLKTLRVDAHNVAAPEHITHHHIVSWKDKKQSRICAHMKLLNSAGTCFHLFNTHLSLPTPFTRQFWSHREKMGFGLNQLSEARSLATFIGRHAQDAPFVVCGDFNSPPGSPVYQFLTREVGLLGVQEQLGHIRVERPRVYPTAGFMRWRMHLDHVFSSPLLKWLDMEGTCPFGDTKSKFHGLSDHVPLIGTFQLG